jgi:P-type Cu+ transporter
METNRFDIQGMTCSACAAHIEKSIGKQDGIRSVDVQLLTNSMKVEYDEQLIAPKQIEKMVEQAGYAASLQKKNATHVPDKKDTEVRMLQIRFWISAFFLLPLVMVNMSSMVGLQMLLSAYIQFLLLLPVLYLNRSFFVNGFRSLFHGAPNMDTLVAVGSSAALLYGLLPFWQMGHTMTSSHEMPLYFESAATILTLVTLGKMLEAKSKRKTTDAIRKLLDLKPEVALILKEGVESQVQIGDVCLGDMVVLKPGQRAPVDGTVADGVSTIDESMLTGESMPVEKSIGDRVLSGSVNQTGYLQYQATRVGADTTLAQMIRLVEEASSSKAPISRLADRISGWFVPSVLLLALMVTIVWLLLGKPFDWSLSVGISILIISCPCALGLATPVAIMVGTGKGASLGLLFRSGAALETTRGVDVVVLDKTGTITVGKPSLSALVPAKEIESERLLQIVASLEKPSEHPLAKILVENALLKGLALNDVESFHTVPGKGVFGRLNDKPYWLGTVSFVREQSIDLLDWEEKVVQEASNGRTTFLVADERQVLGLVSLSDTIKKGSAEAIARMQAEGLDVVMLTGDREEVARTLCSDLGIKTYYAGVLPTGKEQVVKELQLSGRKVLMVGDGINDAPALAQADVGMAIGAGADVAVETADIVLQKNDLNDVLAAIQLSRAVLKNIRQNLFWAFFYNILAIPLAAGLFYPFTGWTLNPMIAAAAMSFSSVTVVLNALRLRAFKVQQVNYNQI